jgi:hypothetical protein
MTKKDFQSEWTKPAPKFTAAQPEVADWFDGGQVPSEPTQQFPIKEWSTNQPLGRQLPQPSHRRLGNSHTWYEIVLQTTGKMERRLMGNKHQFLNNRTNMNK